MSESFGARLRQQREQQHIALTTIAEQTQNQVSLLEGLERTTSLTGPSASSVAPSSVPTRTPIGLEPNVCSPGVPRPSSDVDALPVEPLDALAEASGARPNHRPAFGFWSARPSVRCRSGREAAADKRSATVEDLRVAIEDQRVHALEATPHRNG
jgi:hypothetical protein